MVDAHSLHLALTNGSLELSNLLRNSGEDAKLNSLALVRKRTIPTERPPFVGEVSANFCE
jgi:hypothetical protein